MKRKISPHPRPLPLRGRGYKKANGLNTGFGIFPMGEGEGESNLMARYPSVQKGRARKLRENQTDVEGKLWSELRGRQFGGVKFRRQHPVGPFIVDFCCVERGLVVELDGGQHAEQKVTDERRTKMLESFGYRVLRFWDNEVLTNFDDVLERISEALEGPHPNPLPFPGRGNNSAEDFMP